MDSKSKYKKGGNIAVNNKEEDPALKAKHPGKKTDRGDAFGGDDKRGATDVEDDNVETESEDVGEETEDEEEDED